MDTTQQKQLRIGLFTDMYHPSVNGVVYVIDILREQMEAMGHEVYVFCPTSIKSRKHEKYDPYVVRFPSVKGAFFDDYDLSVFLPTRELKKIAELNLDAIMFFTPSQVGLLGIYAAKKLNIPLIGQYSTDLYEYVDDYPATVPGIAALSMLIPFAIKMEGKDLREWARSFRPRKGRTVWGKHAIERLITLIHQKCDAVVVLSRKSRCQLSSWNGGDKCRFELIPTGVDALPSASKDDIQAFRQKYGIKPTDKVVLYVGRIGAEKNLDILISAMELVIKQQPNTKLMFVGDFEYRETLEEIAADSSASENIIFTGKFPRDHLGKVYGAADIFAFPSLKDTQGLVLHEAAHAGLPIVIIDEDVSEVAKRDENAVVAQNEPHSLASAIVDLLSNDKMRQVYGERSRALADQYTEAVQTKKIIDLIENIIEHRL